MILLAERRRGRQLSRKKLAVGGQRLDILSGNQSVQRCRRARQGKCGQGMPSGAALGAPPTPNREALAGMLKGGLLHTRPWQAVCCTRDLGKRSAAHATLAMPAQSGE